MRGLDDSCQSNVVRGSVTPDRIYGISPLDCLPIKGCSCESSGGIPTIGACVLNVEMKDHVGVTICIDVFQGINDRSGFCARWTKENRSWVHSGSVKSCDIIRGSIAKIATGITPRLSLLTGIIAAFSRVSMEKYTVCLSRQK